MKPTTTEDLVFEATRSPAATTYVPDRYPYVYAGYFMRQFPSVIPADAGPVPDGMTRIDAEQLRQRWAEIEDRTDQDLAIALADAWMQVHGIVKREYS